VIASADGDLFWRNATTGIFPNDLWDASLPKTDSEIVRQAAPERLRTGIGHVPEMAAVDACDHQRPVHAAAVIA
jgi:hypothetical protein